MHEQDYSEAWIEDHVQIGRRLRKLSERPLDSLRFLAILGRQPRGGELNYRGLKLEKVEIVNEDEIIVRVKQGTDNVNSQGQADPYHFVWRQVTSARPLLDDERLIEMLEVV